MGVVIDCHGRGLLMVWSWAWLIDVLCFDRT